MERQIILADYAGFCFGVKRAVDTAINSADKFSSNIYTLGPLIHNSNVVEYLKESGISKIDLDDIHKLKENDTVIIRSHGVSQHIIHMLQDKNVNIIDATCPYVASIHKKVNYYSQLGYAIILVGDKNHPEVIGVNGWCNNNAIISKDGEDLPDKLPNKVCIVSQTTEKQENWNKVLDIVTRNCKEIVAFNTICNATSQRQKSSEQLAKKVDAMLVIGSRESSNTNKLYEICSSNCKNTVFIENADEIPSWLLSDEKLRKIGITAGASTPDWIIKEALNKMSENVKNDFNEQLEYMEQFDKQIHVGAIVKGEIISINEKEAYLNIGYKADALLPLSEATFDENKGLSDLFSIGDTIEAKVISIRNEDGYVVLSRVEMERTENLKFLREVFNEKKTIDVLIKEAVNGGVIANYNGIRIFIPASHLDLNHVDDLNAFVGKKLDITLIEFEENRKKTRIVGSKRELLKAEKEKLQEATWNKLEKDQVVEGEVKRLTSFGAFVDIEGVDGLLHVSEISWGRVNKPSDILTIGDKISVKIIDIDKENKKLSLSLKALTKEPWEDVEVKYPADNIVLGKVVRFADFGAFVELEPGVDGLVHISEISHKRIEKPSDELTIGQNVKAKILDVNKEAKKIALSIKAVE
ncbi:bifunctional 4-hydroxy-3-methylbut-2-enyl diphosphate reductase/30S ribosomal protein S1 [Clostridium oryzae]|uniref:4-hydroxy-3-methylbut-2-enyl diphosphate reductase n=1 Tax=Clostridium oryzae TaxID=1450648 RepID=A0A1V4IBR8_9CLOT|nr:bifunctional 4-hydroxy-3-methylbut-2-enyl diphosphate reductase/30S ribosomal protein S1 [Clostridium oryzae]OPJ57386.1 30S ribosomal protein S1 [Clostridium oryzae]